MEIQPTLNRAIIFTAFPTGKPVNFSLNFHKQTTALQFQIDSMNPVIKNKEVSVTMYRNLENCLFTNTFLNLETIKRENIDARSKFNGIKDEYKSFVIEFFKEIYDFHTDDIERDSSNNKLTVLGFKIHGLEEDLIFFFFQRKCRNVITRMDTIRTAGLQFSTNSSMEILKNFKNNS